VNLSAQHLFSLHGKTALVTGASGYLGRTFCRALLENGARVIAMGRNERLEQSVAEWQQIFGPQAAEACRVDMYDLEELGAALDRIVAGGGVDILVNNAHELSPKSGFNVPDGGLEGATFDQWNRNLMGGLYWPAFLVQKLGEEMKRKKAGSIVNIATMYAAVAPSPALYEGTSFMNPPGYSASKAALLAFTRYVASFWGGYGIRANAILPGPFSNTEDTGPNSVKDANAPFLDRLRGRTCLGRIGKPHELIGALLYLASDASTYTTGQALIVDGGWTVT